MTGQHCIWVDPQNIYIRIQDRLIVLCNEVDKNIMYIQIGIGSLPRCVAKYVISSRGKTIPCWVV